MLIALQSYGLELSDEMLAIYQELIAINTTVDGNYSTADRDRSKQLSFDLLAAPLLSATSGVLWLFPAAVSLDHCEMRGVIHLGLKSDHSFREESSSYAPSDP